MPTCIHFILQISYICYTFLLGQDQSNNSAATIVVNSHTSDVAQSSQTPLDLTSNTHRNAKLKGLLKSKCQQLRRLSHKLKHVKTTKIGSISRANRIQRAPKLLDGIVSPDLLSFLKQQLKFSTLKSKGRNYDNNFKAWALTLYHISGKAYRFLSKLFHLPSKRTMGRVVSKFASDAGFTEKSLYVKEQRLASLSLSAKVCSLLMDEISLKNHLFYDISKDTLIGTEDYGDNNSSGLLANSALVLMVRGILHNWKQPVAYFLVNESCSSGRLKDIINEALLHLEAMGLTVLSIISDQGSNFLSFAKDQGVSTNKPYFEMRGKKYFVIFDPPHLLKSVRNNLLKYKLEFGHKTASWDDIKSFYQREHKLAIRMAPKLTEKHIDPNGFLKMRVKLVSQIFSHSVAAGIYAYASMNVLNSSAIGTAEFIEKMDKIFDSVNSLSFRDLKVQRRPFTKDSPHLKIMEEGIDFFKSIQMIDKNTSENKTSNLKCLNGWVITLQSIIGISKKLYLEGVASFLVTRQLNQDPLENFLALSDSRVEILITPLLFSSNVHIGSFFTIIFSKWLVAIVKMTKTSRLQSFPTSKI